MVETIILNSHLVTMFGCSTVLLGITTEDGLMQFEGAAFFTLHGQQLAVIIWVKGGLVGNLTASEELS